jgi:hypothetical protein
MTIPTSYSVREAILHSLEYFNGKLKKHKLKMNADFYSMIENTSPTPSRSSAPDSPIRDEGSGTANTSK